ncbi:MAG: HAMP domain-containing protein [Nitrospirae bacterium]|nr:HAMP domain-containing protein [Nitrospirota bacterium]
MQPDHETGPLLGLDDSIEETEDSLEAFERRLAQSRAAMEAAGDRGAGSEEVPDLETDSAAGRLFELDRQYAVYESQIERFIHLSLYHPTEQVSEYFVDELKGHYEDRLLPAVSSYGEKATEELARKLTSMETAHETANQRNFLVAVAAFVLAVLLGLAIARSISRPIAVLQEAAAKVGAGELGTRVDLRTRNEMGELAAAFNQMVGDLEASTVSRSYLDDIIQSMSEILIVTDPGGLIRTANPVTFEELGFDSGELFGCHLDLLLEDSTVETLVSGETRFKTKTGDLLPVYCSRSELVGQGGRLTGTLVVAQNLSLRKQTEARLRASLEEKEVLLREVHHRVKNNLQIVSSLLNLQNLQADERADPDRLLQESRNRIRSMALIHEQLYKSKDLANIDFAQYASELIEYLGRSYDVTSRGIQLKLDVEPVSLAVDQAIPCGMILNELVANGVEHAYHDGPGEIRVSFRSRDGRIGLVVADDGEGLSQAVDPAMASTLGIRLVAALADQLQADVEFQGDNGVTVSIEFDVAEPDEQEAVIV